MIFGRFGVVWGVSTDPFVCVAVLHLSPVG